MKIFIIALLIAWSTFSKADNLEYSVLIGSKHLGNESVDYNEINPGVFVWRHMNNYYQIAGVYKNSYSKTSLFAGVGKEFFDSKLCLEAGFVTGYENLVGGAQICTNIKIYDHTIKINFTPGKAVGIADSDVISIQYVF